MGEDVVDDDRGVTLSTCCRVLEPLAALHITSRQVQQHPGRLTVGVDVEAKQFGDHDIRW
jgi:hypothetical protein